MARWFRFYTETLEHPKAQRLPGDVFKGWVNLLCLAARNDGKLPPHADIAFALRMTGTKVTALLDALVEATLLDHDDNGLRPHNWNTRQYKSDVSNERVKRHREQVRAVTCNVTFPVTETPPEAETESEQIKPNPNGLGKKPTKGTRLAADWIPDVEDCQFCVEELGWTIERIRDEAAKFRDYWTEQPGSKGVKIRWHGTWRNWCRRSNERPSTARKPGRATEGERRNALLASVAGELGDFGATAGGGGRSEGGTARGGDDAITVGCEVLPDGDGSDVCEPSRAPEGELIDVAGTLGEIPAGRTETGLGSRPENPQMGEPAEDRADGGGGGIRSVVSASIDCAGYVGKSTDAAGLEREGSDAFDIPGFLRR